MKPLPFLMRCNHKECVRDQTSDHDNEPIDCKRKTQPAQQLSPPWSVLQPISAKETFILTARPIVLIVIFFHQLLVMWRLGRGDLIVEQSRKDETDAGTSGASHVREHLFE